MTIKFRLTNRQSASRNFQAAVPPPTIKAPTKRSLRASAVRFGHEMHAASKERRKVHLLCSALASCASWHRPPRARRHRGRSLTFACSTHSPVHRFYTPTPQNSLSSHGQDGHLRLRPHWSSRVPRGVREGRRRRRCGQRPVLRREIRTRRPPALVARHASRRCYPSLPPGILAACSRCQLLLQPRSLRPRCDSPVSLTPLVLVLPPPTAGRLPLQVRLHPRHLQGLGLVRRGLVHAHC